MTDINIAPFLVHFQLYYFQIDLLKFLSYMHIFVKVKAIY